MMEEDHDRKEKVSKGRRAMQILWGLLWLCGGWYLGEQRELDTLGKSLYAVIGLACGYISVRYWSPY